jgi:hypothetical protein
MINIVKELAFQYNVDWRKYIMIKRKRNKYIVFMILFTMFLTNIVGIGARLEVKAQDINGILAATANNKLVVSKIVDGANVTINLTNPVVKSDWVTITLYNKATNSLVYIDQIKLIEGQGSSKTILDTGIYYGKAKSVSDSNIVTIDNFTVEAIAKSNDANLSGITIGGIALANFASGTTSYNKELPAGTTTVPVVTPTVNATGKATAVVTAATTLPGTTIIEVTAEDGITKKTYTLNFTVAQPASNGGNETPSDNPGNGGNSGNTGNNGNTGSNGNANTVPVQVVVDNSNGKATAVVTVNSSVIAKDKVNEIKPIVSAETKAVEVKVEADKIKDGAGSLAVITDKIKLNIPFKAIDYSKVEMGQIIKILQNISSDDGTIKDVKSVGEVYDFGLALYNNSGNKVQDFHDFSNDTKVKITIELIEAQLKNLNTSKLAALYYNESSKKWEHVGGTYDAVTKTFSFEADHFSKYTIADMSVAPVFGAIATQNGEQGNFLQFKINASSANNMNLIYTASNLPTGATFDSAAQTLNWTPNVDQAGSYTLCFSVTDGVTTIKKDVTVTIRDVPASELVEKALAEKDFYHFNIAYYKAVKVSDEKSKAEILDKLAGIHDLVWNADIANINGILDQLVVTASGKIYDDIQVVINNANISAVDKGYLLGEVTSWGKKLVFTDEYRAAVDAVVNAWNKLDADSVSKAEAAIAKVTNTYSKDYLLGEVAKIKAKIYS